MPLSRPSAVSDNRYLVLDMINASPGINLSQLRRDGGVSNGTLQWHLDKLVSNGRIRSVLRGNRRHYFPAHQAPDLLEEFSPLQARILEMVMVRGGVVQSELASALGVNASTITRNVRRVREMGWVDVEVVRGRNRVIPGSNMVQPHRSN